MKIDISELKDYKAVLKIEDTEVHFLNSLRRIMISELPKLAIDNVIVYDNTSPLLDEIISHRIGLIPIPTDLRLLNFRQDCKCNDAGCPSCTVRYTLSKEEEGTVYSGDLQPEDKNLEIKKDKIPIVELSKDQRIILEVEAILGRGKDHAKWQAVHGAAYKFLPIVTIDTKKCDQCKACIDACPKNILEIKNNKVIVTDIEQCTACKSCVDICENDAIAVEYDPHKFIFHLETDTSLTAKDALVESAKILIGKYEELGKALKTIK